MSQQQLQATNKPQNQKTEIDGKVFSEQQMTINSLNTLLNPKDQYQSLMSIKTYFKQLEIFSKMCQDATRKEADGITYQKLHTISSFISGYAIHVHARIGNLATFLEIKHQEELQKFKTKKHDDILISERKRYKRKRKQLKRKISELSISTNK